MRTIFLTLLLLLTLTACGTKDATTEEPTAEAAATEESAAAEASTAEDDSDITGVAKEKMTTGPIGNIRLKDGSAIEITEFKKLGKYYIYVSGKLNGRSSTVISFTRLRDVQRWGAVMFKDPYNFIITTKAGKELRFLDSRLYLGSDSPETYSFYTTNERYQKELIEVKKSNVDSININ